MRTHALASVALAAALAAGCASAPPVQSSTNGPEREARGATVIRMESNVRSGPLLSQLVPRLRNARVVRSAGCPRLEIRGRNNSNASVYVDGARSMDTCVLEQIQAQDVERVEVYPMGVASRPGYRGNAGGLILVFTRSYGR
jgi:hypothetical protein